MPNRARRGLDRLLARHPSASVAIISNQDWVSATFRAHDADGELPTSLPGPGPWTCVDLRADGDGALMRFAIWNYSGAVFELDEHGAVGEDPIIEADPIEVSSVGLGHEEHHTSFETVAPRYQSDPHYVPTCSCGFRGAAVNTAAAALAMANAHARGQGAEPLP